MFISCEPVISLVSVTIPHYISCCVYNVIEWTCTVDSVIFMATNFSRLREICSLADIWFNSFAKVCKQTFINSWFTSTHEIHENWYPANNNVSTVLHILNLAFFIIIMWMFVLAQSVTDLCTHLTFCDIFLCCLVLSSHILISLQFIYW